MSMKPSTLPANPRFSSGPCAKHPGWTPAALSGAFLGRSHRAAEGIARLNEVITRSRALLGMPDDWRLAIMPGSDTGAIECALWTMLGPRGVDVLAWEVFGRDWAVDIRDHLKIPDVRVLDAPYGGLPDLAQADWSRDVVFTWNGTTSGIRLPDGDWISAAREGLAICDATSAAFAVALPWDKLDVVTYSWQKCLGGEGGHGMLALSPRAVERLETRPAAWPAPKIFRLVKDGKLNEGVFEGKTLNTPSMLAAEDALDGLKWAESIGGLPALLARTKANIAAFSGWVAGAAWADFLAADPKIQSPAVCLQITDARVAGLDEPARRAFIGRMAGLLADEGAAYDVAGHANAPPGLRVWCGPTVETADIAAVGPWLDWAFAAASAEL
ncbi:MAG: phosphoserine transaminase [Rhodospirillales bacterium]